MRGWRRTPQAGPDLLPGLDPEPMPQPPPDEVPAAAGDYPDLVIATVLTATGNVRPGNEDTVGTFGWLAPLEQQTPVVLATRGGGPLVAAVADGLGGHAAGEVASRYAIGRLMEAADRTGTPDGLRSVITEIHRELLARGAAEPRHAGMATTLAALVVTDTAVLCAHAGDSRVYYVESGLLDQLTTDDAIAGVLEQCLGGRPGSRVDPHIRELRRDIPARYLICSDGLHGCVPHETIRDLAAGEDPLAAAAALAGAAYRAGAPDNISVCLVDVPPAGAGPETRTLSPGWRA